MGLKARLFYRKTGTRCFGFDLRSPIIGQVVRCTENYLEVRESSNIIKRLPGVAIYAHLIDVQNHTLPEYDIDGGKVGRIYSD